jgi:SnoaL-like domain
LTDNLSLIQARNAIMDGIYRYCRGIDRMDRQLLLSVFHPSATVEYPYFEGDPRGFVDWMWTALAAFDAHSHQVSNIILELDEEASTGTAEAYVTAALWRRSDDGQEGIEQVVSPGHGVIATTQVGTEYVVRARYFDRWSLQGGAWAIDHRRSVVDYQTMRVTPVLLGEGRRGPEDPSYPFLAPRDPGT